MDFTSWICVLVMWTQIGLYVAGADQKIEVNYEIWEGNVTVFWDPPDGAPLNALYQVQLSIYGQSEWQIVPECNMTQETTCYLGNLISPSEDIKVKVGLFQGIGSFWSSGKRIRFMNMKLLAPEFHLSSTTKSVKVTIFRKEYLAKLFEYGPRYTVTLHPKGDSQAITQIDEDEDGEVDFSSLHFLREYCVNVTVDMPSLDVMNSSLQRCIYTSADRSVVISIATLGVVGTMSFFMFAICFFLRRPGKMPAALKSAVNGWRPMNIGSVQIETITDKGWLLMSNKTEEKLQKNALENTTLFPDEEKERRESTDSGVSVGQKDSIKHRGSDTQTVEDDSGCGSMTGSEDGGRRSMEELPSLDGGSSGVECREDSGLGMGNRDGSDSLKGVDSGLLCEVVVVGDGYRSQSPSVDEQGEITVPCDVDSNMVSPSDGYRSGHVTCLCSDFETCMWCKTRKISATDSASASNEQTNCTFTLENNDRPCYLKNSEKEVIVVDELNTQSDCESSALLISFPLFHVQNLQLDTSSLTLGDVELTFT
ncbi:interleukin-10 receptor subunit alpha [Triplophysa dalaica]|uniref:interleukin-10 receptor subunit alpha n=1 Tax=Triplophysa dalaica TaxID=1582913 RepID=UPI0024DFA9B6|nr:interleukin-10 receptor subunit alpha [Triplophysa dalaica]